MGEEQVRVWVGAFGKHPGWDDHIADQGLETELLTRIKRLLYLEGIGGNLDSGTWDALEPHERLEGYDHLFLWRWREGLAVGRLWSSSDGKGRTRYPMIVCAHCRGLAGSWVAGPCAAAMETLAERCRAATDAAGVITAVDEARQALRAASAQAPRAPREPLQPPAAIVELAGPSCLGTEGLERVMYQLERDFGPFLVLGEDTGTRSRTMDVRPRHMRVPACRDDPGAACELWLRFLLERADETVPLVAVVRRGEGFCDLIAGEPTRGQFACLQSSVEQTPLTTAIPYTIDDAFDERVRARVEAGRNGALRDIDPGRVSEQQERVRRSGGDTDRWKLIGVVAAGLLLLVVLLFAALRIAGGGSVTGAGSEVPPEPAAAAVEPVAEATDGEAGPRRDAFDAWCRAYAGWFGPLTELRGEPRALLSSDEHLASRVLGPIERAQQEGVVLNPLGAVSKPPPRLLALMENPPAEVSGDEVWARTQAALAVIAAVEGGLSSWPTRAEAVEVAAGLDAAGLAGPASELSALAHAVNAGNGLADAVSMLRDVGVADLGGTVEAFGRIATASEAMRSSEDAVLRAAAAELDALLATVRAAPDLTALRGHDAAIREHGAVAADIQAFLAEKYDGIDGAVFAQRSQAHAGGLEGLERLRLWLAEAERPEMRKLDPELDPRRSAELAERLAAVDDAIAALAAEDRPAAASAARAIRDRREELGNEAEALLALSWNARSRAEVERRTRAITREIAGLGRSVSELRSQISGDVEAKVADLRRLDSISTTELASIDAIWRSGRDALLSKYEADGDDLTLFRDAQALAHALATIEDATMVESRGAEAGATWSHDRIQEFHDGARDAAVSALAGGLSTGSAEEAAAVAAMVRERVSISERAMDALITSVAALEAHVENLYGVDEPWPDGGTIRSAKEAFGAQAETARSIAPALFARVDGLERAAAADRSQLADMVSDASTPGEMLVAAWLALGSASPAWPDGAAELRVEMAAAERVLTATRGLSDRGRAGLFSERVAAGRRARWAAAVAACDDWSQLRACRDLREACGGVVEDLGENDRFCMAVLTLSDSIDAEADDAANRSAASTALAAIGEEPVSEAAAEWLARARAIIEEGDQAEPPLDPSAVGPATAGWIVAHAESDDRLVYELRGQKPQQLGFRLVTTDSGGAVYLCETELPVGVVAELTRADAEFARRLVSTLGWVNPKQDTRQGMLTWEWAGSETQPKLVAASAWVSASLVPLEAYFADSATDYPTEAHPMQRLALSDAMFIAARLGCRLPTVDEWRAAHAQAERPETETGWNLRDVRVSRQAAHVEAHRGDWPRTVSPDAGAYQDLRGGTSFDHDDGSAWLVQARGGPEAPFRHLIGNLHEIVIVDDGGEEEVLGGRSVAPAAETPDRWHRMAQVVQAGLIGGSLFGRADAPHDSVSMIKDAAGGWSDVGVRLAFSPGQGRVRVSAAARLRALVEEAPLVRGR